MADLFTYSPWDNNSVRRQFQRLLIKWATEEKQGHLFRPVILISIDDSLSKKPKESKHFEPVGWHFDAKEGRAYGYGVSFVTMHLQCGNRSIPINWRIYLKGKTVRKLNRLYTQKVTFKSKMALAMEMLREVHKNLTKTWVDSANTSTLCWTCLKRGKIRGIAGEVSVIISKRHPGDKRPEFFLCTDTSLSVKKALSLYMRRWAIDVDYLYLKSRLGLGDFRLRSIEGISRYFTLTFLTLAYLSWRKGFIPYLM